MTPIFRCPDASELPSNTLKSETQKQAGQRKREIYRLDLSTPRKKKTNNTYPHLGKLPCFILFCMLLLPSKLLHALCFPSHLCMKVTAVCHLIVTRYVWLSIISVIYISNNILKELFSSFITILKWKDKCKCFIPTSEAFMLITF